jgi:hypothetical protein
MRSFATIVLVLHALTELSVAVLMGFTPSVFFPTGGLELHELARSFGVGAGAVGVLSVLLLKWRDGDAGLIGFLTLASYQAGILVNQLRYPMASVPAWVPPLFHGCFVLAFLWLAVSARAARRVASRPENRQSFS